METNCPRHEDEELFILEENHRGYCKVCRKQYLLAKIPKLKKQKLEAKWKPNKPYVFHPRLRKF